MFICVDNSQMTVVVVVVFFVFVFVFFLFCLCVCVCVCVCVKTREPAVLNQSEGCVCGRAMLKTRSLVQAQLQPLHQPPPPASSFLAGSPGLANHTHGFATSVTISVKSYRNNETLKQFKRLTEHKQATGNGDLNNKIAEHHLQTNHRIDWDSAECVIYSNDCYQRLTLESWFTNLEQTPLNRCQQLPAP